MLKVTLLDKSTNKVKVYPSTDINVFQWTENNWCCDCNREIAFLEDNKDLDFDKDCTSGRYVVISAEGDFEGYTKEEFIKKCNSRY